MYCHYDFLESHVRHHVDELLREAEIDRLLDQASGPRRPIRRRVADWLVSVAEWVDDQPQGSFAHAAEV